MISEEKYEKMKRKAYESKKRSYEKHIAKKKNSEDYRKREFLNEIRISNRSGSHINCIRVFPNNSFEHEQTKFLVCMKLAEWGHDFVTEAIFNDGKRADIIDLKKGIIYEVMKSETDEKFNLKLSQYPEIFEVRSIDANKEFNEDMLN